MKPQKIVLISICSLLSTILCLLTTASASAWTMTKTTNKNHNKLFVRAKINHTLVTPTLNSGLVGWWTFDGADTGSTYVLDKSGNGRNFTRVGTSLAAGKIGQGGFLAGNHSNYYHRAAINPPADKLTVSFWYKPKQFYADSNGRAYISQGTTVDGFVIYQSTSASYGRVNMIIHANTSGSITTNGSMTAGKWNHVAMTYDGTNMKAFLNGFFDKSAALSGNVSSTSNELLISEYLGINNGAFVNGTIDDVRIYNRALSAKEITQLYQEGTNTINKTITTMPNLNKGLQGWWTFDGADTGSTYVIDKSGNGRTGTRAAGNSPTAGKIGQALSLTATTTQITTGKDITTFLSNTTGTVSVWIKPATSTATNITATTMDTGDIILGDAHGVFELERGKKAGVDAIYGISYVGGLAWTTVSTTPNVGKWTHIVYTLHDGTRNLYANGVLVSTASVSNPAAWSGNFIIGRTEAANNSFIGKIDDVRIWNRALSAKEVTQLYMMGK